MSKKVLQNTVKMRRLQRKPGMWEFLPMRKREKPRLLVASPAISRFHGASLLGRAVYLWRRTEGT